MSQYAINKIKQEEIENARARGGDAAARKVADRHLKEAFNPITCGKAGAAVGGLIGGPAGAAIGGAVGVIYGFFKMEP